MTGGAFGAPTGGEPAAIPPSGVGRAAARPRPGAECPCGSGGTYGECCGPLHDGAAAPTAEALMRSRYCAFVTLDENHLVRTWHPGTRPDSLSLDPRHTWTGLEILEVEGGGEGDVDGVVIYRAGSRDAAGHAHVMTETSRFARRAGRWVYVDGDVT